MTFGEKPFHMAEPQFTLPEACQASGVAQSDLRNWTKRAVIDFGERHRTGRWLFSAADVVQLRTMGDLIALAKMDPSSALPISENVVGRMQAMFANDPVARRLAENADGSRKETRIVVFYDEETNDLNVKFGEWDGNAFSLPIPKRGDDNGWLRRPVIVIPADQIIFDTLDALFKILEGEFDEN